MLVLGEGVLRLIGPPPDARRPEGYPAHLEFQAALGWQLSPGAINQGPILREWEAKWGLPRADLSDDVISSLGFRDSELAVPKPRGQKRILSLGDSSVFGSGVVAAETYTQRIESALNPPGTTPENRPVEVINAGVPAYSTYQSMVLLQQALPLSLDGLIVYNMNSDIMASPSAKDRILQSSIRQQLRAHARTVQSLSWLRYGLTVLRAAPAPVDPVDTGRRVSPDEYRDNLSQMARLSAREGLRLVLVIPPRRDDIRQSIFSDVTTFSDAQLEAQFAREHITAPNEAVYHVAMVQVGREYGLPVVNAAADFVALQRANPADYRGPDALFVDPMHPSSAGHARLAALILPHFADWKAESAL